MSILEVSGLVVDIPTEDGDVHAVQDVSFDVREGEFFGIVGESGSGKSVLVQSVMGLIPQAKTSGTVRFQGTDLLALDADGLRRKRGGRSA
ncbi:ATP-binding cassette domain-containing protein [Leucobacter sp. HNU]|uniref:ATP-binding cassette domain-containing protein n=1 Tax=Leucobacter sp. HNU TaxID=3236805 RepID=UPI003A809411